MNRALSSRGTFLQVYSRRFLELPLWYMAWDRYALGAAMVGQMSFTEAQEHKAVVTQARALVCVFLPPLAALPVLAGGLHEC